MIEKALEKLAPPFRQRAIAWLEIVNAYLMPMRWNGYKVIVTETLRTSERQSEVAAAGKSSVSIGYHNFGRAFDFLVIDDHGVAVHDGAHPAYEACGLIGEGLGGYWGGRFQQRQPDGTLKSKPDYDHIEWRRDGNVEQLKARAAAGVIA